MGKGNLPRIVALSFAASCAALVAAYGANGMDSAARVDASQPNPQPPYPDSAQLNGEEGIVLLDVYVRPNGRATKVRVAQTSGFEDLDTAAVQGVLNWRYIPAIHDGDVVSDWATVRVQFQLPRPPAQPSQ